MFSLWRQLNEGLTGGKRALLPLFLTAFVVFTLIILGQALRGYLDQQVLGASPGQELRVGLLKKDVSILRMSEEGAKTYIRAEDMTAMKALPGVREVFPVAYADQPSKIDINMMGNSFSTEMVFQAVDPAWIATDVPPEDLVWEEGKAIPVVINTQILAIYNNAYAKAKGMPELSPQALKAPLIRLSYGPEPKTSSDPPQAEAYAKIVGFSPRVALGAAITLDSLAALNQALGTPMPQPLEAVLILDADADTDAVRTAVTELGYNNQEPHQLAQLLLKVQTVVTTALIALLLCLSLFVLGLLDLTVKYQMLLKRDALQRLAPQEGDRLKLVSLDLLLGFLPALLIALIASWLAAWWINSAWLSPLLEELTGIGLTLGAPWLYLLVPALAIVLFGQLAMLPRLRMLKPAKAD